MGDADDEIGTGDLVGQRRAFTEKICRMACKTERSIHEPSAIHGNRAT